MMRVAFPECRNAWCFLRLRQNMPPLAMLSESCYTSDKCDVSCYPVRGCHASRFSRKAEVLYNSRCSPPRFTRASSPRTHLVYKFLLKTNMQTVWQTLWIHRRRLGGSRSVVWCSINAMYALEYWYSREAVPNRSSSVRRQITIKIMVGLIENLSYILLGESILYRESHISDIG